MRDIKFKLIKDGKVVGYEMWHEDRWVYRFPEQENFSLYTPFISHDSKNEYTGLKDKNGKEIYEGDIIETSYLDDKKVRKYIRTVVTWDDNNYDYGGRCIGFDFNSFWNYYEVIGNIYENPELLKGN